VNLAIFDCRAGVSGNMMLGAILDAGLDLGLLTVGLAALPVTGYEIEAERVTRRGLAGTHVTVHAAEQKHARHLGDILDTIQSSTLPDDVVARATAIFKRLAHAEARVHGTDVSNVHFHEVGALDAIVDIVGSALGLHLLGVQKVYSTPLHLGTGTIKCAHGTLPVPAPATLELVRDIPVYGRDVEAELVTPTGAAILTTIAESYGTVPAMTVDRIGYGAGSRELPFANLLRLTIGKTLADDAGYEIDEAILIETNIDDMNPEWYDQVMTKLFDAGAMDVFLTPILMKQGRPALQLSVLVRENVVDTSLATLFRETTTIGVRMHSVDRRKLERRVECVKTAYGEVAVKLALHHGVVLNTAPEHRDCQRIAEEQGIPLKEVHQAAQAAARQQLDLTGRP